MNGPKRPRDEPPGAFCESNIATRRNQCTIVTNEPTTTQVRYKTLDKRHEGLGQSSFGLHDRTGLAKTVTVPVQKSPGSECKRLHAIAHTV